MKKGLEAFNSIKETWKYNIPKSLIIIQKDNMEIIEKELKALEILKNALSIHLVETIGNKYYIEITGEDMVGLCKENYYLLKEVLL